MNCDFCNALNPQPQVSYTTDPQDVVAVDTTTGKILPLPFGEDGKWCACQECAEFIDREDWDGLVERVIEAERKLLGNRQYTPEEDLVLRAALHAIYHSLKKGRKKGAS